MAKRLNPQWHESISTARLSVQNLSWSPTRSGDPLLHTTTLDLDAGNVLGIVGVQQVKQRCCVCSIGSIDPLQGLSMSMMKTSGLSARAVAQRVAAVLQEQPSDFALTVGEIIALGRTPHRREFAGTTGVHDKDIIESALDQLNLKGFEDRHVGTLSGGERQRIIIHCA